GWRGMSEVWPACLLTGASFAVTQFAVSNFHGPWLVDTAGAVVSIAALYVLLQVWKPAARETTAARETLSSEGQSSAPRAGGAAWKAWLPWILLSIFVFLWGLPQVKAFLNKLFAPDFPVPWLHNRVQRMPEAVPEPRLEPAIFAFNALSATGTALLLAGIIGGFGLGLRPLQLLQTYARTFWRVRVSLLTIALMLALGFTTRYSGTATTLGLALASSGFLFPFFSPLIGWLGVALTGSVTSSN